MNITSRHDQIVELVRAHGFVSIERLAEQFCVSPQTIRRDVNTLCDANVLRRRHGGAELLDPSTNTSYDARRSTRADAKARIAAEVARIVPNHASVMLGIGTTPEIVAAALSRHDDLTVVTNNLNVAMAFSENGSNRIVVAGGTLRLPDRDVVGAEAESLFRSYRADFGIVGVGGIERDGSLLDFDRAEVRVRLAIQESCRRAVLVADRSKFLRAAPACGGSLKDLDLVILDGPPEPALAALIEKAGVECRFPEEVLA